MNGVRLVAFQDRLLPGRRMLFPLRKHFCTLEIKPAPSDSPLVYSCVVKSSRVLGSETRLQHRLKNASTCAEVSGESRLRHDWRRVD